MFGVIHFSWHSTASISDNSAASLNDMRNSAKVFVFKFIHRSIPQALSQGKAPLPVFKEYKNISKWRVVVFIFSNTTTKFSLFSFRIRIIIVIRTLKLIQGNKIKVVPPITNSQREAEKVGWRKLFVNSNERQRS